MGIPSGKHVDTGHRPVARGRVDRSKAPPGVRRVRSEKASGSLIFLLVLMCLTAPMASAETVRLATFNTELSRDGPGLLLRDILKGADPQVTALVDVVGQVTPDILVLQNVDYDLGLVGLNTLRRTLAGKGMAYSHVFARAPNFGLPTGIDRDGDGRLGEPEDAQAFGRFNGQGGMAILSRFPIDESAIQDFSTLLWRDIPGALLPWPDGAADKAAGLQRLSSGGHWVVPVSVGEQTLHLMVFHATPPVFDGPEDRNGKRNHDEIMFWRHYMDGAFGARPEASFVIIGDANLDPVDGEGRKAAIHALVGDKRVFDPMPQRAGTVEVSDNQVGDPRLDTVAWPEPVPGHLRVSYILPSVDLGVDRAEVHWPPEGADGAEAARLASRHKMVWVDLVLE